MDLKSLPAIAALERVVKTLKLTLDDQKRCGTLVKLLKTSPDGRLRYDAVLEAVFPPDHRPTNPKNVFTKFRQRVAAAALESGETFSIDVSGSKRNTTAAMLVTFMGDDAAAGSLTLPANPHYRYQDYAEQRAQRDIRPIFLSNADGDAELVGKFMGCLNTTLKADADDRVRGWANASWWHRKDLNQNLPHETMQRAIDDCKVGIILFSRELLASEYVRTDELPRFDPRKVQSDDPLARDAIAIRLTSETVPKIHAAVGHEAFQLIGWVSPDSAERLSFEDANPRQREAICDRVVSELKRILLAPLPGDPTAKQDDDECSTSVHGHLAVRDDPKYRLADFDAQQQAQGGRVTRSGTRQQNETETASETATVLALAHLREWATHPTATRWFAVLGELGMGKTFLCRMLDSHLKREKSAPRPIYIDLKASASDASANRALTLESIIANSLRVDYDQPKNITVDTVLGWVRKEGAIAIFDGLDELAVHLKDEGTRALISELLRVLPPKPEPAREALFSERSITKRRVLSRAKTVEKVGKAIISCRTHYFPDIKSQNGFLLEAHRGKTDESDVESFTLLPFTEDAIRRYFVHALGAESADHAFELISEVHNLRELAERPYLLSLITSQIDQLEDLRKRGERVNAARLYGLFSDDWLQRDEGKHEFELSDKRIVMQALAAEMWRESVRQWSHERLKTWLYIFIGAMPGWSVRYGNKADVLAKDLRTATFVVRVGDDSFRFAHTSLQEYFLSGYLLLALSRGEIACWDGLLPSEETLDFMWQRWDLLGEFDQKRVIDHLHDLLAKIKPSHSAVAPLIAWQRYTQRHPDNQTALINLDNSEIADYQLHGLGERRMNLPWLSLVNATAHRLSLTHVDATDATAASAKLTQSRFEDCDFERVDVRNADLRGSLWREVYLRDSQVEGSRFDGALLDLCDVSGVILPRAGRGSSAVVLINPLLPPDGGGFTRVESALGTEACVAAGHAGAVRSVAYCPSGTSIASGSDDNTIKIWDAATGREKTCLVGHKDRIFSIAYSPDGRTLASGSGDGSIKLWDLASGLELMSLTGHGDAVRSVTFGLGGKFLASSSDDNTIRIWSALSGRERRRLVGHKNSVLSVAFSSDGKMLASGAADDMVKIWDPSTGHELLSFSSHKSSVRSVAFSPDGKSLATASSDETIKVWNLARARERLSLVGHRDSVVAVVFSNDGKTLATGSVDNTIKLWDAHIGRPLLTLTQQQNLLFALAFNPGGTRVASGWLDGTIKIWDVTSGHECLRLAAHKTSLLSVAISPDGKTLAAGSNDNHIQLWDVVSGRQRTSLMAHKDSVGTVTFSPNGQTLASGSADCSIKLWDAASGREQGSLLGHKNWIWSLTFSQNGSRLASSSGDNTIKIWDVSARCELASIAGGGNAKRSIALSPDGLSVASSSSDFTVQVWDISAERVSMRLAGHKRSITAIVFSADGAVIATGSADNTIKLWDVRLGSELAHFRGHKDTVLSIAFSPDGKILASGSLDHTIMLWDVKSGHELANLKGHTLRVHTVAFDAEGKTLFSGSDDNAIKRWDIATGSEQRSHIHLPRGAWVTLDSGVSSPEVAGLPVIAASDDAPEYLRRHWRSPATGELAWMPWVPPGSELWAKYES